MEILQNGFCMIPNVVLYDKWLTDKQKLLYGTISSLCAEKWYCRASNKYIWDLLNCKEWTISQNINALKEKWYISMRIDDNYKRYIELNSIVNNQGVCEKSQGGMWNFTRGVCEKSQDINISDKYKINNNEISQEQPQEINNSIPKQDSITPTLTNGDLTFDKVYKLFYHKSWHKPKINECKKVFDSLNLDKEWYEMLVKDLNLFRIEYKYWIKDQQYRPWFAKYVGWFNAEWVNEEYRLKTIIKFHMENRDDLEKMKKRYKDLCDTFGKETVDSLVKSYGRSKNKITLNIN